MIRRAQLLALLVGVGLVFWNEIPIWLDPDARAARLNGWLAGFDADWLPLVPFIFLFPVCWFGFPSSDRNSKRDGVDSWWNESPRHPGSSWKAWLLAVVVASIGAFFSWKTGQQFEGLPPAYHDEFSYLFQAETFLAGRWSFPSFEPVPEIFNQMHVLNEGRFASRYFPGTGAWIAIFLHLGNPWLGHQIAQGFVAMMVFWTGRELANSGTGLLAGVLTALSPGLILFSNLLLAHHPTLIGLTLFLWAFCRMIRTGQALMAVIAGVGLSFAMLCRPMTAAGFAFPFGVAFVWWWGLGRWSLRATEQTSGTSSIRKRSILAFGLGLPLVIGFAVAMWQNFQITGDPLTSPYQLYTDTYTPRHVYGFSNVIRGEQNLGPKVIENYDRWAENLTPELAAKNVGERLVSSLQLTLGIVPLAVSVVIFLLTMKQGDSRFWLIAASIISLHVAHIPYWFSGIMGWHYVMETAPLWILILAETTRRLFSFWGVRSRRMMISCWLFFIATNLVTNLVTIEKFWPATLDRRAAEVRYPRQRYGQFRESIETLRDNRPAIVFVISDPADRSMDYVSNPPNLTGPVLVARLVDRSEFEALRTLFSDRVAIIFDAKTQTFETPVQDVR